MATIIHQGMYTTRYTPVSSRLPSLLSRLRAILPKRVPVKNTCTGKTNHIYI